VLLTLDPGIRGCGVALLDGPRVAWAKYVTNPVKSGADVHAVREMARAVWHALPHLTVARLLVEWPQVYTYGKGKGDPNDLLALVGVGSALAALLPGAVVEGVRPRVWKGTIDGDAMVARIQSRVTAAERVAIQLPCASLAHNVWDAVGIGLWRVGRLARQRVIGA
jgi:hypothetical protein